MEAGARLGPSRWLEVDQERIDRFASATEDHQGIHVDPAAAAAGPFGTTVAHGFLTLSLLVPLLYEVATQPDGQVLVNYGVNRVRFPAAVPSGSRIRALFEVVSVEEVPGGRQATLEATVEREGGDKPVCVAQLLLRTIDPPGGDT
jgi:acyl dehydratase